jgi:hypothetical protein
VGTWLAFNNLAPDTLIPANLLGLAASVVGMVVGSLAPRMLAHGGQSIESALHQAAQAEQALRKH